MPAYSNAARAYQSIAAQASAGHADPHQLICMLMDGALSRMAAARGCIEHNEKVRKAELLHRVGAIIDELRVSLDHRAGGDIAANLERLYDYISRRIADANLNNDVAAIDESVKLLQNIRRAWGQIPAEARALRPRQG